MINNLFLRRTPLPKHLIYKTTSNLNDFSVDKFIMFSVENPTERSVMKCFPTMIEREGKEVPSLYIWQLHSLPTDCGLGSEMLNFAKIYSEQKGCHGYIHLCADSSWNPNRVPQIFYRKCGLSTPSASYDHELDCFIKKHKKATYKDFQAVDMFYPPIVHPVKSSSKFLDLIKRIFSWN